MDTSFITINTHSSIRLQTSQGAVIYVDPYGFETEPHDADLILVTHTHLCLEAYPQRSHVASLHAST